MERAQVARDAEIVVLNTCTVTEGADKDARASIRRLRRVNRSAAFWSPDVTHNGLPRKLAALPGVTWVVGTLTSIRRRRSRLRSVHLVLALPGLSLSNGLRELVRSSHLARIFSTIETKWIVSNTLRLWSEISLRIPS